MKTLISFIFLISSYSLTAQALRVSALSDLPFSDSTMVLLVQIYQQLNQVPEDGKFSSEQIDSIKQGLCIVNLKEIEILSKRVSSNEIEMMTKSKEPLLQIVGFWLYSQRERSHKLLVQKLGQIAAINSGSLEGAAPVYCGRFGFSIDKPSLAFAPYVCFDMITTGNGLWMNSNRIRGKYLKRAERVLAKYKEKVDSHIVTIH